MLCDLNNIKISLCFTDVVLKIVPKWSIHFFNVKNINQTTFSFWMIHWLLRMRTYVFMHQIAVPKEKSCPRKFVSQFHTFFAFTWFTFPLYFIFLCLAVIIFIKYKNFLHEEFQVLATLAAIIKIPCNIRSKRNLSISIVSYLSDNCTIELRFKNIKSNCTKDLSIKILSAFIYYGWIKIRTLSRWFLRSW